MAVGGASAHFDSGHFTHDVSGCNSRVDPITVVFYLWGGYTDKTVNHVRAHTAGQGDAWNETYTGWATKQFFYSHGVCGTNDREVASASVFETRYHMRLRYTQDWDPGLGFTAVGAPHYEDIQWCSHAVRETVNGWSGFDQGRRKLYDAMAPAHYTFLQYWGNTEKRPQCDGQLAWSNGQTRYIEIPSWTH